MSPRVATLNPDATKAWSDAMPRALRALRLNKQRQAPPPKQKHGTLQKPYSFPSPGDSEHDNDIEHELKLVCEN